MSRTDFKQKYWGRYNTIPEGVIAPDPHVGREYIVLGKLLIKLATWQKQQPKAFPEVVIVPSGIGTLSQRVTTEKFKDLYDKYDFTIYTYNSKQHQLTPLIWVDVTGSHWDEKQSAKRYGEPIYAILSTKVNIAADYNVADRVFFVHYQDKKDRLKVLSALQIINLHKQGKVFLSKYERDAVTDYYIIPAKHWKNVVQLKTAIKGLAYLVVLKHPMFKHYPEIKKSIANSIKSKIIIGGLS